MHIDHQMTINQNTSINLRRVDIMKYYTGQTLQVILKSITV